MFLVIRFSFLTNWEPSHSFPMGQKPSQQKAEGKSTANTDLRPDDIGSGAHQDGISPPPPPSALGLVVPMSPSIEVADNARSSEEHVKPDCSAVGSIRYREAESENAITNERRTESSVRNASSSSSFSEGNDEASEATALLGYANSQSFSNASRIESLDKQWQEADKPATTWKNEFLILTQYSLPLMVACLLQFSLTGASVVAVGHLGKTELGAVSLAIMTSNVTGYCIYAGLATALDTLCAQAYGSGKPLLVGLQLQRMVYFLWLTTIPIAAIWLAGTSILLVITPDRRTAELAGLFLKILILGAPGFAMFEAGKRFVQAQGLFNANLYVLLICAPANAFMNWLFVWVSRPG
jgi:MatE